MLILIGLLVLKVFPGAISCLLCAGAMLLTVAFLYPKVYKSISWTSVIMIAAMIPMGLLSKKRLAQFAIEELVSYLGSIHPSALLAGAYFCSLQGFSQTINNSATAVLMCPIAVIAATTGFHQNPTHYRCCERFHSFPNSRVNYYNAMVMSAGGYKFWIM